MLYLLTGKFGCGKTTWLNHLVDRVTEKGFLVDGLITPAIFEDGEKTGIDLMLLPRRTTMRFAHRRDLDEGQAVGYQSNLGLRWVFHDEAMKAANEHLAPITKRYPAPDLFVVDELGPVEFMEDRGFTEAMRILDQGCYREAIAVVRPLLIDDAIERFSEGAGGRERIRLITPRAWSDEHDTGVGDESGIDAGDCGAGLDMDDAAPSSVDAVVSAEAAASADVVADADIVADADADEDGC